MAHLLSSKLLYMGESIYFHCPGCDMLHPIHISGAGAVWDWNKNPASPTFNPSLLVFKDEPGSRCHLFIIDGKIQFLGDCFHDMKNTTVEMVDIPEPETWLE